MPTAAPIGDLVLTKYRDTEDEPWRLLVRQADPRIRVSVEMLAVLRADTREGKARFVSYDGDVLTVNAENQRVIYRRIPGSLDTDGQWWLMEWPD